MKVRVNSKKGLKASLSVLVDKKTIQKKLDEKLHELQHKVHLKGFRPGKVPTNVIKSQFGKAIYGEVIDGILKETSTKAIEDNKLKQGKFLPGMKIPIVSKTSLKEKTDCLLVLAWNFFDEIKKKNSDLAHKFISIKDLEN